MSPRKQKVDEPKSYREEEVGEMLEQYRSFMDHYQRLEDARKSQETLHLDHVLQLYTNAKDALESLRGIESEELRNRVRVERLEENLQAIGSSRVELGAPIGPLTGE